MNNEDKGAIISVKRRLAKNPNYKFFVASKNGNNAVGRGANRSVILGSGDGKNWIQIHKVWGDKNEQRAREIVNSI